MKKVYSSILDELLDDGYAEADLSEAKSSGDELLDLTHSEIDKGFVKSLEVTAANETHGATRAAAARSHRNEGPAKVQNTGIVASQDDWHGHAAKVLDDDSVIADAMISMESAKGTTYQKKTLSDSEVMGMVDSMLNAGIEPRKVAARLEKLAELNVFNRTLSHEYLDSQSGVLGLAYLKPNQFMDSCPETFNRLAKQGTIRAKSVKKIAACEGCSYKKASTCNLYHLPIVASQADLMPIINNLVPGAKNKKAALVKKANRDEERVSETKTSSALTRVAEKTHISSVESLEGKKQAQFTVADVVELHKKGSTLAQIFTFGTKKAGSVQAQKTVTEFIGNLKRGSTKINLTQIDCSFLKGKLATSNPIIGDHRCASCTYRTDMHCGLTGGTLLSVPGLNKAASNHKIAAGAPKDGHQMLSDFDMTSTKTASDIEFLGDYEDDIEAGGNGDIS